MSILAITVMWEFVNCDAMIQIGPLVMAHPNALTLWVPFNQRCMHHTLLFKWITALGTTAAVWVAAACLDVDKSVLTWCYYMCNCCYKIPYIQSIYKGASRGHQWPLDSCTNTPAVLNIIQKYKILANIFASFLEHDEAFWSCELVLLLLDQSFPPPPPPNLPKWYTCRLSDTRLMTKWIPAWGGKQM